MADAAYRIVIRDLQTLDVLGEIPEFRTMMWERAELAAGRFRLVAPRSRVVSRTTYVDPDWVVTEVSEPYGDLLELQRLVTVERTEDGFIEFAGVIRHREIDAISGYRTLTGPDLKGYFLARRIVAADTADPQSGVPAETAMKHYLDEAAGPSADASRRFSGELDVTWTIEADGARGETVEFEALRMNLLYGVLEAVGKAGDLIHDVVINDARDGYEYRVYEPTNATIDTGAIPFSVSEDNVAELILTEDVRNLANAITVAGAGSGDARDTRLVIDGVHIAAYGRTEGLLDRREATSNDQLDQAGAVEIEEAIRSSISVRCQPLGGNVPGARYRTDWDIGWTITIAIEQEGIAVDRRVVGCQVTLERSGSDPDDQVAMYVGATPRTATTMFREAWLRGLRAQFE